jgi:hypothetical protein
MKKLFLLPIFLIANQIFAQLNITLHHYNYYNFSTNVIKPTVSIYAKKDIGKSFNFTSFSLINNKWGESLIGLEYAFTKWLSVEFEIGIETNIESYGYKKNLIRTAQILAVTTKKFSLLGVYEQGSMDWFDVRSFYHIKHLGIGAMASKYYGLGPVFQYRVGKSPFSIWSSWLYNWDTADYGSMLGIYLKM